MIKRAGGQIINGKRFWWTDFYIDELLFDEPFFKNPSFSVPNEWLPEMLDEKYSAYLMPIPKNNWN